MEMAAAHVWVIIRSSFRGYCVLIQKNSVTADTTSAAGLGDMDVTSSRAAVFAVLEH